MNGAAHPTRTPEESIVHDVPNPPSRRPLVIADDRIQAGAHAARVGSGDLDALLREYLRLIRRARGQWRNRTLAVRRADLDQLAEHLEVSTDEVLTQLARLMGSTRRQQAALLAILATGASLITISQPAAAAAPEAARAPIVVEAPAVPGLKSVPHAAARGGVETAPGIRSSSFAGGPQSATADEPESAEPTVAVGPPPVPPATDDDGNAVAVGLPPVPPATDDDGNAVAVGLPPVPPAPDG
jgi:hypothetical protein